MAFRRAIASYSHELLLAVALVTVFLFAQHLDPLFVSTATQQGLLSHVWDIAILSLPMTFIIITGGIDLSVGSAMGLVSVVVGMLFARGVPIGMAAVAGILTGIACGFLNGWFVAKIRVHPLIVTLATYSAFRGLAEGLSSAAIYQNFPKGFLAVGTHPVLAAPTSQSLLALPAAGWFFISAAILAAVALAKAPFGRSLYAIGFNERAARYSGIKVDGIKLLIYSVSGLAAGLVSVNYSALRNTAQASVGEGMELKVITAVVLGGTSIFGGRGRIIGTLLGVALIHETGEFVGWYWNHTEIIPLVLGGFLLVSVAANALISRKSSRS